MGGSVGKNASVGLLRIYPASKSLKKEKRKSKWIALIAKDLDILSAPLMALLLMTCASDATVLERSKSQKRRNGNET